MTFQQHKYYNNIDIFPQSPFIIRSRIDLEICEEYKSLDDENIYVKIPIQLNKVIKTIDIQKAILIAQHFIQNPDPTRFTHILFEDGNKLNLNPDNLYWCDTNALISRKYNKRQTVQELPPDAVEVKNVNGYEFDHYYYSPSSKIIYLITKNNKIQIVSTKRRAATVSFGIQDISGRTRSFTLASFIRNLNQN